MFKDKECEGCTGVENYCVIPIKMALYKCPCLQCLVKTTCHEQCREYEIYLNTAEDFVENSMKIMKVCGSAPNYINKFYLIDLIAVGVSLKSLKKLKGKIKR